MHQARERLVFAMMITVAYAATIITVAPILGSASRLIFRKSVIGYENLLISMV